ncbi:unnamed protein product [Lactuca saligna]|uniref:Uncharacterized protein n=1 Tax=Lactuca saligna TaxID=75948 RepID=A0AA36A3K7_LACSI|nr:unnamed protein product [Lactuca saligna]
MVLGGSFDDDDAHGGSITISGGKEPPTVSYQCLLSSPPYLRFNSIVVSVAEPMRMRWRIQERLNKGGNGWEVIIGGDCGVAGKNRGVGVLFLKFDLGLLTGRDSSGSVSIDRGRVNKSLTLAGSVRWCHGSGGGSKLQLSVVMERWIKCFKR